MLRATSEWLVLTIFMLRRILGTSLAVQWLRIHPVMQGHRLIPGLGRFDVLLGN